MDDARGLVISWKYPFLKLIDLHSVAVQNYCDLVIQVRTLTGGFWLSESIVLRLEGCNKEKQKEKVGQIISTGYIVMKCLTTRVGDRYNRYFARILIFFPRR
ncbi:hypothetical protein J2T19_004579 [Paenibacillus tundrae]|uniref:Uncharacterized protein n=1 Tax=Paenibacillus tundrae TaxID=528187 RepID=A0ABT9WJD8_9BACL|nr:hypothetical protein [Paenibacillus tundrae]